MTLEKLEKIIKSGNFGKVQVISATVNIANSQKLRDETQKFLSWCDKLIFSKIKKESQEKSETPYLHGFYVKEYANGELVRISFSAAPFNQTNYSVFLTDGEIRYDSKTDKITAFIQKPNYVGDEPRDL